MRLIIVTGLSGAGKSLAVKAMEDMGFYCVDNMPPELIPKFADIYNRASEGGDTAALVCDIRGGKLFEKLDESLARLSEAGFEYEILFLDASDEALVKRYKETRRTHPLAPDGRVLDGIRHERALLNKLRGQAAHIADTSDLSATQLKEHITAVYGGNKPFEGMLVHIVSFGFKNGIPLDADLVFDVRFLPNPFYIAELKEHTGQEECVRDYVMRHPQSVQFSEMLYNMLDYLIPHYIKEGKSQLVVCIGCTGGHHRSVTIAEELGKRLENANHNVVLSHRDIQKRM